MIKLKRILIVSIVILLALGVMVIVGFGVMTQKTNDAVSAQVNVDINMDDVKDGTYVGESDGGMVSVKVEVTVVNHKIIDIQLLKHENGKGKPAEAIIDDMIRENTDTVDSVSGATISSKTIRNAVNLALQKGMK